jgi:hypothetical protein
MLRGNAIVRREGYRGLAANIGTQMGRPASGGAVIAIEIP